MEQARYWMWTKRRHGFSSPHHLQASTNYDDSWEEQAFAEDAAGSLGGCIWPPRSYSCSFCGREFRSAQALGGHMNVHRRDRARLKQSPSDHHHPHDETLHHLHDHQQNIQTDHIQNTFLPVGFHEDQPDQVCDLVYSPNPNSDHSNTLPSSSSTSRVSPPPSKEYYPDKPLVPPFSSPIVREHSKKSPNSSLKSWSSFVADRYYHFSDLRSNEGDKRPRIVESGCRVIEDYALTESSSVTLNLVVRRTRPTTSGRKEESTVGCKRKRNDTSTLPFFLEPISMERNPRLQPADDEVPELISPSSVDDDIDLELRLGDRPKVK